MDDDQFSGLMAVLERIALALEGKPKVNLYSGPRHNGQHGPECLVCHPAPQLPITSPITIADGTRGMERGR